MRRMLGMIRHRGPDQFGIYQDEEAATLGSARLSILDLDAGQQPISNEDGTLWIVFNGEIFNYVELRKELERRGHRFATHTDTEVLVHLYEDFGASSLDRLNGQFAFAIWDARERQLFLARDRLGVRPAFYTQTGDALVFGSEIKALLTYPGVSARIDAEALDQVFHYWSTLPGRTIFHGIHEVPAGHFLTWKNGHIAVTRYWDVSFPAAEETWVESAEAENYLEEFEALLTDATLIRLRSDVPVGAYLSGGLDSSLITQIIASRSRTQLATFSVAFEDRNFDESAAQLNMARVLNTRHEVVRAAHADIGRVFPEVVWHAETALTRTAPAPMFLLSSLVHDCGFKVVTTGEGADEFLAGYDIFKEQAIRAFWMRRPESAMRPQLFRRLYPDIRGLAGTSLPFLASFFRLEENGPFASHAIRWRNGIRNRRFFSPDFARLLHEDESSWQAAPMPGENDCWGSLQRGQYLEGTIFLPQYLLSSQGDRMAMAHSVEARHPFLDYRVVEFCNRLPASLKLRGLRDKYLLRRLGRRYLPPEVWRRPKRPYRAPIHRSFFGAETPDYVRERLSRAALQDAGFFNPAAVEQLVRKASSGAPLSETDDMAIAGILSTQLAHEKFVARFREQQAAPADENKLKVCKQPALLPA